MSTNLLSLTSSRPILLPYSGMRAVVIQTVLLTSAVVLPIAAHMLQAPVRILLPMHWPVLLAGLLYGWRAGAVTGALAPLLSYLVSGYPMPNILPSMTFELFAYGSIAGILRERYNLNPFLSIGTAVLVGRIIFVFFVIVTNRATFSDTDYFQRALLPGIIPALVQIVTLPFLAQWLVRLSKKNESL